MQEFLALKASAGSGKTFALTVRYISLLLLDASPKEILTLTFTNKAAAQMAERIYDTLLSLGEDEAILDAVVIETELSKIEVMNKKDEIIKKFISSELSIYTIDKFINKILREFSGYIGINNDFEIKFDATGTVTVDGTTVTGGSVNSVFLSLLAGLGLMSIFTRRKRLLSLKGGAQ